MTPRFSLPPFPTGWYCVSASAELAPGTVLPRVVCGRELAVFRTLAGGVVAVDAVCPHLGAHLGHTSHVDGETLRCAFHGFRFDATGACVATGYGTRPPPRCALTTWPVHEVNGLVLVYFDAAGRFPSWRVPVLVGDGWSPLRTKHLRLPAHVQDLAENSVDVGHLGHVHGYRALEALSELATDGPLLRARYAFRHPRGLLGIGKNARAEIDIRVHGLGYSQVDVTVPELGFSSRQFVLATPSDGEQVDLRIGMSAKRVDRPRTLLSRALAKVPAPLFEAWITKVAFRTFCDDVLADVPIWSTKRYVDPPRLAEGDGPILRYRKWARQFYPELVRAVGATEVPAA